MSTTTKPVNQKAWLLVLPVIICVAFSAILPLMTVVTYSVQDIGTHWMLTARIGEHTLKARLSPAARAPQVGEEMWLQVMGPHTCLYLNDELMDV